MDPYAIVETGGKQYMVHQGDTIRVEKLDAETGAEVDIDRVLAISDGTKTSIGKPVVKGAKVTLTVLEHMRDKKVVSFKKKRRKTFKKKIGHRQPLTVVQVSQLQAG